MPSVTACELDWSWTNYASVDELNIGTYQLRYIVTTDGLMAPNDLANGALSSSPHPLPSQWSSYSFAGGTDSLSRARDFEVQRWDGTLKKYYITVAFRPPDPGEAVIGGGTPIKAEPDPLARDPVIWWDREVFTATVLFDKDNVAMRNPIGDLYPDPIEQERSRGILVVEKNVGTLAEVVQLQKTFDQAVNQTAWSFQGSSYAPRTVLCREASGSPPISETLYEFFHMTFRFQFAVGTTTFDQPMVEMGEAFYKTNPSTSTGYEELIDEPGMPKRFPIEAGHVIALNSDGTRLGWLVAPLIKQWRIRREVDFNSLPF